MAMLRTSTKCSSLWNLEPSLIIRHDGISAPGTTVAGGRTERHGLHKHASFHPRTTTGPVMRISPHPQVVHHSFPLPRRGTPSQR